MDNPKAVINLSNISHNIAQVKSTVNTCKILAVIKADAYGHGAVAVAKHLDQDKNVSAYGVSRFSEAEKLINAGISKPILLMEGVISQDQLLSSVSRGFWLVIQDYHQLMLINELKANITAPVKIWLKFDTGMHRLGLEVEFDNIKKIQSILINLVSEKIVHPEIVIMSHFACADELQHNFNAFQLDKFHFLQEQFQKFSLDSKIKIEFEYSIANSAGVFGLPKSYFNWVRPGVSMYGSCPFRSISSRELNLKPSMEVYSKIITIKHIKKGACVGYGATWTAQKDGKIAIIASGYADCYPRIPSSEACVWLRGVKCRIIGRVSMDMLAIDCSSLALDAEILVGDKVELWGEHITIDEAALACNTVSYELFTRITSRVEKLYI